MMKEYLENRIKTLTEEKSHFVNQLQKQRSENINSPLWVDVKDRESRIDELKITLKYYMENKYENS